MKPKNPHPLTAPCDLVVIGGGMMGLSCAIHAAQSGRRVVLVEQDCCGSGQTAASGGQVLAGYEGGATGLLESFPLEVAKNLYQFTLDSRAAFRQFLGDTNIKGQGNVTIPLSPAHYDDLVQEEKAIRQLGGAAEWLSAEEARNWIDLDHRPSLLLDREAFHIDPKEVIAFLRKQATDLGVEVREYTQVESISKNTVDCGPDGCIQTKHIAITAGLGSDRLLGHKLTARAVPVFTLQGEMESPPLAMKKNLCAYDARVAMAYFRKSDSRFFFGGCDSQFPKHPSEIRRTLEEEYAMLFHQSSTPRFKSVQQTAFDATGNGLPHITISDSRMSAYGLNGHGLALAFGIGKAMSAHLDGDPVLEFLSKHLQAPVLPNLGFMRPWVTSAVLAWIQARERLKLSASGLSTNNAERHAVPSPAPLERDHDVELQDKSKGRDNQVRFAAYIENYWEMQIPANAREADQAIAARGDLHDAAFEEAKRPRLDMIESGDADARLLELRLIDIEVVTQDIARKWAQLDVRDARIIDELKISDDSLLVMAGNRSAYYQSALREIAPDIAERINAINLNFDWQISAKSAAMFCDQTEEGKMADPNVYLSTSDGKFRVIQNGEQISADKTSPKSALDVAAKLKLTVSDQVWNGNIGKFQKTVSVPDGELLDEAVEAASEILAKDLLSSSGKKTVEKFLALEKSPDPETAYLGKLGIAQFYSESAKDAILSGGDLAEIYMEERSLLERMAPHFGDAHQAVRAIQAQENAVSRPRM